MPCWLVGGPQACSQYFRDLSPLVLPQEALCQQLFPTGAPVETEVAQSTHSTTRQWGVTV